MLLFGKFSGNPPPRATVGARQLDSVSDEELGSIGTVMYGRPYAAYSPALILSQALL